MEESILSILEHYKTLAVVGLSSKTARPSHGVSAYMKACGYRIIPVNPNETEVLGVRAYPSLDAVPEPVEVVLIFRRPEYVREIAESAVRKGAKVIWMQEGVRDSDAAARARQAGLTVIEDRCILKEHAKRFVAERL